MRSLRTPVFAVLFGLTGIGTAVLGATLPATLHVWQLTDGHGGLLLLGAWGGSTAGALLARGTGQRSAALGIGLAAASLFVLSSSHPPATLLLFFLYGLGLGTTMTSISLLRAREVSAEAAGVELNRLNLLWAAGACLAPSLAAHSLRLLSVATLFRSLAAVFALAGSAAAVLPAQSPTAEALSAVRPSASRLPWAPLPYALFAAASVGMESAVGSWLTTYARRETFGVAAAVWTNSAFWTGLLLSRAAHSVRQARPLHTPFARAAHVGAAGASIALLILIPHRGVIPLAGMLCGLGLGPLYPLVLSAALPRYRSTALFVMAGVGASLTPWLTGALSSTFHSLRIGLLAPAAAFALLLVSGNRLRSRLA